MPVKAKFFVREIGAQAGSKPDTGPVKLGAVSRGAENATWSSATPSGSLEMHISNPHGYRWFKERLGKEVYLTFEDVDESIYDPTNHAYQVHPYEGDPEVESSYYHGVCAQCGKAEDAHTSA